MNTAQPLPGQPAPPPDLQAQISGLSVLLHIVRLIRRARSMEELNFTVVNETHLILEYDEALLFTGHRESSKKISCISGIATFDSNTPKIVWLNDVLAPFVREKLKDTPDTPLSLTAQDLPEDQQAMWTEYMSLHGLVIPFEIEKTPKGGFFLFSRGISWKEQEIKLLQEVAEAFSYGYTHQHLRSPGKFKERFSGKKRLHLGLAVAAILAVLCWPVHETVIAPVEITAKRPWVATAPLEGVIKTVHVTPNQSVKKGDLLFELDDTTLRNEVLLAGEALERARQELRQARQQAVTRPGAGANNANNTDRRADAFLLELEVRRKESELAYKRELLEKNRIYALNDGIAIFSDPRELEGKPVRTGEMIMSVADNRNAEIEIMMPVEDSIEVKPGDQVMAYLHVSPLDPIHGKIRYVSYRAEQTEIPDVMAYKIKADIDADETLPRIGLKGNAKVRGERTIVLYTAFRKPLGYIRRTLGL